MDGGGSAITTTNIETLNFEQYFDAVPYYFIVINNKY